jgi:23S rRNA pseudouridine2605 synthase
MQERLHKVLAHAGFGSRRGCEQLIEEGRVTVNGRVATIGDKGDPQVDEIRVDDRAIRLERKVYFLVNKPPGYLCTNDDPAGRRKVGDLLIGVQERVYPVGRLDADSRGLVLMTNDGDLAARLTHPRFEVPKTYEIEVDGRVTPEVAQKLVSGVWLSDGKTGRARLRVLHRGGATSQLEVTLREGRNREVRRMMVRMGHKVRRLTRTRIGHLTLHGLGPGKFRPLTSTEIGDLYREAAGAGVSESAESSPSPRRQVKGQARTERGSYKFKASRGQFRRDAGPGKFEKGAGRSDKVDGKSRTTPGEFTRRPAKFAKASGKFGKAPGKFAKPGGKPQRRGEGQAGQRQDRRADQRTAGGQQKAKIRRRIRDFTA